MLQKINTWAKSTIGFDGLLHFAISAILMGTLKHIIGIGWLIAFIIVILIGFFKEGYDKISDNGDPELKDLFCNACGVIVGLL